MATTLGTAVQTSYALAMATGGNGPENYVPHLPDYIGRANGLVPDGTSEGPKPF